MMIRETSENLPLIFREPYSLINWIKMVSLQDILDELPHPAL